MKRIIIAFILVLSLIVNNVLCQTIIISEECLPYTSQTWFYSGAGNDLDGNKIKSLWDEGKRITSASYTNNGWFVVMAKSTNIGMQTYKIYSEWPGDWIKENWDKGYYISSISNSGRQWLVVMSKGEGYTTQTYNRDNWNTLSKWINDNWNAGYYITDAAYNGSLWTVVMSKHPKFVSQGYIWERSNQLKSSIQSKVWDKSNNIQLMKTGDGEYFIVYCKYSSNNNRKQSWQTNPEDVAKYIQGIWNQSKSIAYVGGGPSTHNVPTQRNQAPSNVPSNNGGQTWREELGAGMFAINKGNPNGARQRTIYRACIACRGSVLCGNCYGTGQCTICNGQGGIITAGYGNYIACVACGQTGRCNVCHGTGKCVCSQYEYPGYMPGSTIVVGADGKVIYNSRDYDNDSPTSSPSSSRPSRSVCPKCGGRKFVNDPIRYAPASASGWAQPYHNYSGYDCPYCSYKTEHYHTPCTECFGHGNIRN